MERDAGKNITTLTREGGKSSPLSTDDKRERPVAQRKSKHRLGSPLVETDGPDPKTLQLLKSPGHAGNHGDLHMLDGAGGDLCDRRSDMSTAMTRENDASDSGALGAAQQGTQILRICDTVDDDEERHLARIARVRRCRLVDAFTGVLWVGDLSLTSPGRGRILVLVQHACRDGDFAKPDQIGKVRLGERLGEGDNALGGFGPLGLLDLALCHEAHRDVA